MLHAYKIANLRQIAIQALNTRSLISFTLT